MPYYRSSLEIYATRPDPSRPGGLRELKRPVGAQLGAVQNWILLDNPAAAFGCEAVLWSQDPITDPLAVKLADDSAERLSAASRTNLAALCGDRTYSGSTAFQTAVVDFMKSPPIGKWNAVRGTKGGRLDIWLGPGNQTRVPFYTEASTPRVASKTFVDNFIRANGNLNGMTSSDGLFTWLEVDGTEWESLSNNAACTDFVTFNTARANADLDTDDHSSEITVNYFTLDLLSMTLGVLTRWTAGTNGYGYEINGTDGGEPSHRIYRYDNDADITTGTAASVPQNASVIRLESDGSSHTGFFDAETLGPATNTTFTGQLRTGISAYSNGPTNDTGISNFEAADLHVTATTKPRLLLLGVGA